MKRAFGFLIVLLLARSATLHAEDPKQLHRKTNIVVILADDIGYGDVGCYGAKLIRTPNIDRLAAEGRRFTDAHSTSAVCTPSRYGLLTGQYPFRIDSWGPLGHRSKLIVDPRRMTVARMLKQSGYATACFGKWHLGFGEQPPDWNGALKPGPLELGFDYYFGIPTVSSGPPFVFVENHGVFGLDPADPLRWEPKSKGPTYAKPYPEKGGIQLFHGGRRPHELYDDEQLCRTLTERSIRWIEAHRQEPFFLYLATTNNHHPFTPQPRFRDSSRCGAYGDFVQEFDWAVGEILRTLEELKLSENTLVIVTSDNGGMLNETGQKAWKAGHRINGELLGFKFDVWEGGHRVPFILRLPGYVSAGSVCNELVSHIDLTATLAAAVGGKLGPDEAPDSLDASATWFATPSRSTRDFVVLAPFQQSHLSLREANWIYIPAQGGGGWTAEAGHLLGGPAALKFAEEENSDVVDGAIRRDAPSTQLYDLRADPSQRSNVVQQYPEIAKRMSDKLARIKSESRSVPPREP